MKRWMGRRTVHAECPIVAALDFIQPLDSFTVDSYTSLHGFFPLHASASTSGARAFADARPAALRRNSHAPRSRGPGQPPSEA